MSIRYSIVTGCGDRNKNIVTYAQKLSARQKQSVTIKFWVQIRRNLGGSVFQLTVKRLFYCIQVLLYLNSTNGNAFRCDGLSL